MKIFDKNKVEKICYGLTTKEAACRCGNGFCRHVMVTDKFIFAYAKFRKLVGVPLKINSLNRCAFHNFNVGGKAMSRHLTGEAVDIDLTSLSHLTKEEIEHAAKMAGFTFVLFYPEKNFVHLDVR